MVRKVKMIEKGLLFNDEELIKKRARNFIKYKLAIEKGIKNELDKKIHEAESKINLFDANIQSKEV